VTLIASIMNAQRINTIPFLNRTSSSLWMSYCRHPAKNF